MTLTELRYITAVARERHFGRAAAACFVSQPTLSVAIKKLEEELNVTIFERHQHEIHITDVGKQILEQAQFVLEQAEQIKLLAQESSDELTGQVRLGVIYTIGPYLIPKLISYINQIAPDLTLIIEENFTADLASKLRQGELDIVIASTPFDFPAIETKLLYKENFMAVLPKKHKLCKRKQLKMEDLMDDVLLLLRAGNCFRDQVIHACAKCDNLQFSKDKMQKTLESSSIETIRQMVAAGVGITVLPSTATQGESEMSGLLQYRPFSKPSPTRDVILAHRTSYPKQATIQLIQQAVAECKLNDVEKVQQNSL